MAVVRYNLWARKGSISLPDKNVPFWGFAGTFNGLPQFPGPIIRAVEGDIVRIRLLKNPSDNIEEPVSIMFPGQEDVRARILPSGSFRPVRPQYSGDNKMISLTDYLDPQNDPGVEYIFTAEKPGIYLYESGTNPEKQIQMGLYGAIEIMPRGYDIPWHPNYKKAYGNNTRSEYDIKKILVIGEIDSTMHNEVTPGAYYNMLKFKPDYWIINGRCYPDTSNGDNNSSQPYGASINCRVGQKVLLRIINAGFQNHTFNLGGSIGRVIAEDSFPLKIGSNDRTYEKSGVTLGSGKSYDVVIVPDYPGEIYLCSREYNHLVNNDEFPGGMMTVMKVIN